MSMTVTTSDPFWPEERPPAPKAPPGGYKLVGTACQMLSLHESPVSHGHRVRSRMIWTWEALSGDL